MPYEEWERQIDREINARHDWAKEDNRTGLNREELNLEAMRLTIERHAQETADRERKEYQLARNKRAARSEYGPRRPRRQTRR